jgi:hypothetical protein
MIVGSFFGTLLFSVALASVPYTTAWGQTSDTQPPALTNLTMGTSSVDVTLGAKTVTFQVSASEDLSGLTQATVNLVSPSGAQFVTSYGYWSFSGPPVLSGTATVPVVIPRYAEPGTWIVNSLIIYDRVNNRAIYSTTTLRGLGYPTTLTVLDATPDLVAPQLTAINMTPAAVDVSAGPATVQVDLTIFDDISGFSRILSASISQ